MLLWEHKFSFSLRKYLGVGLLGDVVSICLTLWKLPNCFPQRQYILHAYQKYTRVPLGHNYIHISTWYLPFLLYFFLAIHLSIFWYLVFYLNFPNGCDTDYLFYHLPSVNLWWDVQILCPFLNWIVCFLIVEFEGCIYSGYKSFLSIWAVNICP